MGDEGEIEKQREKHSVPQSVSGFINTLSKFYEGEIPTASVVISTTAPIPPERGVILTQAYREFGGTLSFFRNPSYISYVKQVLRYGGYGGTDKLLGKADFAVKTLENRKTDISSIIKEYGLWDLTLLSDTETMRGLISSYTTLTLIGKEMYFEKDLARFIEDYESVLDQHIIQESQTRGESIADLLGRYAASRYFKLNLARLDRGENVDVLNGVKPNNFNRSSTVKTYKDGADDAISAELEMSAKWNEKINRVQLEMGGGNLPPKIEEERDVDTLLELDNEKRNRLLAILPDSNLVNSILEDLDTLHKFYQDHSDIDDDGEVRKSIEEKAGVVLRGYIYRTVLEEPEENESAEEAQYDDFIHIHEKFLGDPSGLDPVHNGGKRDEGRWFFLSLDLRGRISTEAKIVYNSIFE